MKRRQKSKAERGLVTRTIVYRNRKRPHDQNREIKVDVKVGDDVDDDYATGLVAVRTTVPLADVLIVKVV